MERDGPIDARVGTLLLTESTLWQPFLVEPEDILRVRYPIFVLVA